MHQYIQHDLGSSINGIGPISICCISSMPRTSYMANGTLNRWMCIRVDRYLWNELLDGQDDVLTHAIGDFFSPVPTDRQVSLN